MAKYLIHKYINYVKNLDLKRKKFKQSIAKFTIAIEYNKDYYDDRDVKPEESIFFKLTIIPFGESTTPNLKN